MTVTATLTANLTAERDAAYSLIRTALAAADSGQTTNLDVKASLREAQLKQGMLDALTAALA